MSVWDSIGTTYVEAATSTLPLHRVVVFTAGFVGSLAVHQQTHLSIFETIARTPLTDLTSFSNGPLGKAEFSNVLLGVALAFLGWCFSRLVLRATFALAARSTNLWERARTSIANAPGDLHHSLSERQTALELIDKSLSEPRARLRSRCAVAELLGGLGIGCFIAAYWGNLLDSLIGTVMTCASIFLQVSAVQLFIADYLGPAMLKAKLQGRRPPDPTAVT